MVECNSGIAADVTDLDNVVVLRAPQEPHEAEIYVLPTGLDSVDFAELGRQIIRSAPNANTPFSVPDLSNPSDTPTRFGFDAHIYPTAYTVEIVVSRLTIANQGRLLGSVVRIGEGALQFLEPNEKKWGWGKSEVERLAAEHQLETATLAAARALLPARS